VRSARIDRAAVTSARSAAKDGDPLIPISISSEYEVERSLWGERWIEILSHAPEAVDLSRAEALEGLPLLAGHAAWQPAIGRCEGIALEASERKLRGVLRFSRSQAGRDALQDVEDGICREISVGYRVLEAQMTEKRGETEVWRITRWQPVEVSLVPIPADTTVGVGRSALGPQAPTIITRPKERTMENDELEPGAEETRSAPKPAQWVPSNPDLERARREARTEADEILALAEQHGIGMADARALVPLGKRDAALKILEIVRGRNHREVAATPAIELTDKERRRYSFARAILGRAAEDDGELRSALRAEVGQKGIDDGFEREVEQELATRLPPHYKRRGGVLLPTFTRRWDADELHARAGLDSATATKGAELKFTQPGEFLELFRNRMKLFALGARILGGLTGPVTFPKQSGAATASWVGENPGADVADSNLLLTTVGLAIKTLQGSTSFSRQLLVSALSASVDAEQLVRDDLSRVHALAIDLAGINGSGSANQPRGILNTSGIGSVAIGANGGVPTFDHMVDLETAVVDANADVDVMGYLTTPGIAGKLKKTQEFSGTNGVGVWRDGQVNGYRAERSKQVPSTLTKGTSTGVCHAVLFGVFSEVMVGEWGVLELITDPLRLKKQAMIEVTSFQMVDVALRHPEALAAILDAKTS
jgi:HK97 family phage major capsid protein/HK97 family phage prohead protease